MTLKVTRTMRGFDWDVDEEGKHFDGHAIDVNELKQQLDDCGHNLTNKVVEFVNALTVGDTETFAAIGSPEEKIMIDQAISAIDPNHWNQFKAISDRIEKDLGVKTVQSDVDQCTEDCENHPNAISVTHQWREGPMRAELIGVFDPNVDYNAYTLRTGDSRANEPYVCFYCFETVDEAFFPLIAKYFKASDLMHEPNKPSDNPSTSKVIQLH